jgi:hypothetical protein
MTPVPLPITGPDSSTLQQVTRLTLGAAGDFVTFPFNPGKVSVDRSASTQSAANLAGTSEDTVRQSIKLTIQLSEIKLYGKECQTTVQKLLSWTVPYADSTPRLDSLNVNQLARDFIGPLTQDLADRVTRGGSGTSDSASKDTGGGSAGEAKVDFRLPVLNLLWGATLNHQVTLEKVGVVYDQISPAGTPVAATVDLKLREYSPTMPLTNPTSGGLPGRGQHTVVAGDDLVRIAHRTYGSPKAWRAVALANGLDDPLRLGPGRRLFLPSTSELDQVETP